MPKYKIGDKITYDKIVYIVIDIDLEYHHYTVKTLDYSDISNKNIDNVDWYFKIVIDEKD